MSSIKLKDISTKAPKGIVKDTAKKKLEKIQEEIAEYHDKFIADGSKSLLVIFQGMDSSGKDSAVAASFRSCSPIGLSAYSFKKPTPEEMGHDFLWRVHKQAPGKGQIKVFLRSHYEDVLIQRVHKWIDMDRVKKRLKSINHFEELLTYDNNTTILKFYMHLSKDQQEIELMQRVEESDKHWKHNDGDWEQREYWDDYMEAYEDVLNESDIPWNIIPVDDRWYKNYAVAEKILETLKGMDLKYPPLETELEKWKK